MACSGTLTKSAGKPDKLFDKFCNAYGKMLAWCLKVKWVPLTIVLALFVISIVGAANMGTQFFPQMEGDQMGVTITMDEEIEFDDASKTAANAAEIIKQVDGVATVGLSMTDPDGDYASSSASMMTSLMSSSGNGTSLYVLLDEETDRSFNEIRDDIEASTTHLDCEVSAQSQSMDISMLTGSGVSLNIFGNDLDTLHDTATDLADEIAKIEGTADVSDGFEQPAKEIRIIVDKEKTN